MSWKETIRFEGAAWLGVQQYAQERIAALAEVCISPNSTEAEIRAAQAGITEMRALLNLPSVVKTDIQARAQAGNRRGY